MHYKEFHNLYFSPDTVQVIESRTVKWIGHVILMGEMRNV
jgi:hypothetical protein